LISRDIFSNLSPFDHRYSLRENEYDKLEKFLSEKAKIKYQARVEVALIKVLVDRGICPNHYLKEVEYAVAELTSEEIYCEEKKTRHNIRALVNVIQRKVSPEVKPFVHLTATSFDIVDTANMLRFKKVTEEVVLPELIEFEKKLMQISLAEKKTIQIGRTHGQHAVPITLGFALAEYVSRLGGRILAVKEATNQLRGKFSGAVGAYNASSLFFSNPADFEKEVLAELGLSPATHSTQIVEPEFLTDFMHSLVSTFSVLASLSDDMRHLQRTEIAEVGEYFEEGQVGSSTMPHKRNPINYENVKSLWKAIMPRMTTVYLDQLSEHQRDLTNSASARFLPDIIIGLYLSTSRLNRVFAKFAVNHQQIEKNLNINKNLILAEPLYILLASYGHPAAHETVRKLTLQAEKTGKSVQSLAENDDKLNCYFDKFTKKQRAILREPGKYIGQAVERTEDVVVSWQEKLNLGRIK